MHLHGPSFGCVKPAQIEHDERSETFFLLDRCVLSGQSLLEQPSGLLLSWEIGKEMRETVIRKPRAQIVEVIHPFGHGFQKILKTFDFLVGFPFQPGQPIQKWLRLGDAPGLIGTKGRVNSCVQVWVIEDLAVIRGRVRGIVRGA